MSGAGKTKGSTGRSDLLTAPRAASFAVTFKVGYGQQLGLPGMDIGEQVVVDLLDCLEITASSKPEELEERIPDPAYRRNFVALARRIAPDGDTVSSVGFTTGIEGKERRVLLTRRRSNIRIPEIVPEATESTKPVSIRGILKFADSRKSDRNEIRIVDQSNKEHRIVVPEGMMDDIVRPLWDFAVVVVGNRRDRRFCLTEIHLAEETEAGA